MDPHDVPARCWVAFGYQNHLVPVTGSGEVAGSCGVLADPADVVPCDERPTCSVCATTARTGDHRIVPFTGTIDC